MFGQLDVGGKTSGEGARLYDAAVALKDACMPELGIAIDGGRQPLNGCNGCLVPTRRDSPRRKRQERNRKITRHTCYVCICRLSGHHEGCVTPDIKQPGKSKLLFIDIGNNRNRLGGTSLAQVYNQIGNESPDVDDPELLKRTFNAIQKFIADDLILSGHDRSDGGLITTILEMAFSGNCGMEINIIQTPPLNPPHQRGTRGGLPALSFLFSEELGLVIEYLPKMRRRFLPNLRSIKYLAG